MYRERECTWCSRILSRALSRKIIKTQINRGGTAAMKRAALVKSIYSGSAIIRSSDCPEHKPSRRISNPPNISCNISAPRVTTEIEFLMSNRNYQHHLCCHPRKCMRISNWEKKFLNFTFFLNKTSVCFN